MVARGGGGGGGQRGGGGGNFGGAVEVSFGGGFSTGPTGFTKTIAAGLNYSDVWSPKTTANGSYFYNNQNRINNQDRFRETFVTGTPQDLQHLIAFQIIRTLTTASTSKLSISSIL